VLEVVTSIEPLAPPAPVAAAGVTAEFKILAPVTLSSLEPFNLEIVTPEVSSSNSVVKPIPLP
jgi:hypothetical protein